MRFSFRSAADIAAGPRPQPQWLCERLQLGPGRSLAIGGAAGSGKSAIALQVALEVCAGLPVFGCFEARSCPAALLDLELGTRDTEIRIAETAEGLGVDLARLGNRFRYESFPNVDWTWEPGLVELLTTEVPGGLLVVDSISAASHGGDENDVRAAVLQYALADWSNQTGGCAIVVAHTGHDPRRLRGTTARRDMAGALWLVDAPKARRGVRVMTSAKAHPSARHLAQPISLRREQIGGGWRLVADEGQGRRSDTTTDRPEAAAASPLAAKVLEAVAASPGLSKRGIVAATRTNRTDTYAAVEELVLTGLLVAGTGRNGGGAYFVPSGPNGRDQSEAAE